MFKFIAKWYNRHIRGWESGNIVYLIQSSDGYFLRNLSDSDPFLGFTYPSGYDKFSVTFEGCKVFHYENYALEVLNILKGMYQYKNSAIVTYEQTEYKNVYKKIDNFKYSDDLGIVETNFKFDDGDEPKKSIAEIQNYPKIPEPDYFYNRMKWFHSKPGKAKIAGLEEERDRIIKYQNTHFKSGKKMSELQKRVVSEVRRKVKSKNNFNMKRKNYEESGPHLS